ncbi:hypothetical protein U1839_22475 [Sphingomonas sp. RT2P30]|uniref:hypothetical protein n=1 Tax=Parasphingomonas halimpatiens TaxID=3096162 RepID=UPI002FCAD527
MTIPEYTVWVFRNDGGMLALVDEPLGTALPPRQGPWDFVKLASLSATMPDEQHALALITVHGYCCFDETPDEAL